MNLCRNIDWLEPWDSLCTEGSSFEQELYKELGENHVLYSRKVTAIGRRYDRDDLLFEINDIEFKFAVVHLTFSGKDESGTYPRIKLYKDLDDWINRCMIPEHNELE